MSKGSILKAKSFNFSIRIVRLNEFLRRTHKAHSIAEQVLRSGTAIGALVREAEYAESRKDFLHKLYIGLKEANETIYWLELIYEVGNITEKMFNSIGNDATELLKMLISSIKTIKYNMSTRI